MNLSATNLSARLSRSETPPQDCGAERLTRAPAGSSRVTDDTQTCQQLAATLLLVVAVTAIGCSHYNWGSPPPAETSSKTVETSESDSDNTVPPGPVVETVVAPPDWGLDGNALANVTVRALHRHGARRASRTPDKQLTARLTCRLQGDHPRGFGPQQLARVLAHCQWHAPELTRSLHATGVGTVSTVADTPGGQTTIPARRRALRTAARQALSRAASQLLSAWRSR